MELENVGKSSMHVSYKAGCWKGKTGEGNKPGNLWPNLSADKKV